MIKRLVAAALVPFVLCWSIFWPASTFAALPALAPIAMEFASSAAGQVAVVTASRTTALIIPFPAAAVKVAESGARASLAYNWVGILKTVKEAIGMVRFGTIAGNMWEAIVTKPWVPDGVDVPSINRVPYGKKWPDDYADDAAELLTKCNDYITSGINTFDASGPLTLSSSCVLRAPEAPADWPTDGTVIFNRFVECRQSVTNKTTSVVSVLGACFSNFVTGEQHPSMMPVTYRDKPDGIKRLVHMGKGFVPDVRDLDWPKEYRDWVTDGHLAPMPFQLEGIDPATGLKVKTILDIGAQYFPRVRQEVEEKLEDISGVAETKKNNQSFEVAVTGEIINHEFVAGVLNDYYYSLWPADYAHQGTLERAADSLEKIFDSKKPDDLIDPAAKTTTALWAPLKKVVDKLAPFKSIALDMSGAQCPRPQFEAFNKVFTFTSFCDLMGEHGGGIGSAMMVVWSILSVTIVLRA